MKKKIYFIGAKEVLPLEELGIQVLHQLEKLILTQLLSAQINLLTTMELKV